MTATLNPVLLTAERAAAELSTTPLNVKRLASRGVLRASWVGNGEVRIAPADLQSYAASGCPDFVEPKIINGDFSNEGAYTLAGRLEGSICEALAETAKATPTAPAGPKLQDVVVPLEGKLAALAQAAPYEPTSRITGQTWTTPFKSRAEGFSVVGIRHQVRLVLAKMKLTLGNLYDSQERYRSVVDAAWAQFTSQSFRASRTYPAAKQLDEPTTVTWRLPYSALPVDVQRVYQLAF